MVPPADLAEGRSDARAASPPPVARAQVERSTAAKAAYAVGRPPQLAAALRSPPGDDRETVPVGLLRALDAAAGRRWQVQSSPAPPPSADAAERSWPDGRGGFVTLRLRSDGAHWIEGDGGHWFVPLDAAALQALREAMRAR
jgi:hypothetical protein